MSIGMARYPRLPGQAQQFEHTQICVLEKIGANPRNHAFARGHEQRIFGPLAVMENADGRHDTHGT